MQALFVFAYADCWFSHEAAQIFLIMDDLPYQCKVPVQKFLLAIQVFCLLTDFQNFVGHIRTN